MKEHIYPVLCGGTFFTLLLQARRQKIKNRDHHKEKGHEMTEPNMFIGLIKTLYSDYPEPTYDERPSFRARTSAYKNCTTKTKNFLFLDSMYIEVFGKRVREEYKTALEDMHVFMDNFINTDAKEIYIALAELLLDLIRLDKSIEGNDEFYVCPSGRSISKTEMIRFYDGSSTVCLPALLLGIWHFIITDDSRKNNSIGRETIELWDGDPLKNWSKEDRGYDAKKIKREIIVTVEIPSSSARSFEDSGTQNEYYVLELYKAIGALKDYSGSVEIDVNKWGSLLSMDLTPKEYMLGIFQEALSTFYVMGIINIEGAMWDSENLGNIYNFIRIMYSTEFESNVSDPIKLAYEDLELCKTIFSFVEDLYVRASDIAESKNDFDRYMNRHVIYEATEKVI